MHASKRLVNGEYEHLNTKCGQPFLKIHIVPITQHFTNFCHENFFF